MPGKHRTAQQRDNDFCPVYVLRLPYWNSPAPKFVRARGASLLWANASCIDRCEPHGQVYFSAFNAVYHLFQFCPMEVSPPLSQLGFPRALHSRSALSPTPTPSVTSHESQAAPPLLTSKVYLGSGGILLPPPPK